MAGQQGTRKTKEVKSTTDAAPPPPPPPSKKPPSVFQSSSISVSPTPNYASIYSTATQPMESSPQGQPTMSYLAPKFERGQAATQIKAEEQKQRHAAEEAAAAEQQRLAAQAAANAARVEQTRIENERVAAEAETARLLYEQAGVSSQKHPMEKFWQDATETETKKVEQGTSFWGGGRVQTTQESERQIQVLLADIHIQNTTGDIEGIRTEIGDLRSLMDQERARLVNDKDKGFDAWNEAVLVNESSVYKQSKFRIEELQAKLLKKEKYLESETLKKEEWEALSLTEKADVAFSSGISFEDPMQKPADITSPVKTDTLEYVDKVPDLNVQKPDKGRPDKDSIFGAFDSLKTKAPDYLGAVLDPLPSVSAELGPELAAKDQDDKLKTIDDMMEAQKQGEKAAGYDSKTGIGRDTLTYDTETGTFAEELVIPFSPVSELRPDIGQIYEEEQKKAPEGWLFSGFDDYGKPSYVEPIKSSVVTLREDRWATAEIDLSTGKLLHLDRTTGKVIPESERYVVERTRTKVDQDKLDSIAKGYAWQAEKKYLNMLQKERFDAIGKGDISVGSFIALQSEFGDTEQMTRYFAEIGVDLTAPMKSISIMGETKLTPRKDKDGKIIERTFVKDEEAYKTTGVELKSITRMAQDDVDRINKIQEEDYQEQIVDYNVAWADDVLTDFPFVEEFTIYSDKTIELPKLGGGAFSVQVPDTVVGPMLDDTIGVTVPREDVLSTIRGFSVEGKFGSAAGMQPAEGQIIINPAKAEEYKNIVESWQHKLSIHGGMFIEPSGELTSEGFRYLRDKEVLVAKSTIPMKTVDENLADLKIETGVVTLDSDKKTKASEEQKAAESGKIYDASDMLQPTTSGVMGLSPEFSAYLGMGTSEKKVGVSPFAVGVMLAPSLAVANAAELKKFEEAPARWIFENVPDVKTDKGLAMEAAGEVSPHMTYSEKVDADLVVREGWADDTKYNISRAMSPLIEIYKAGGQIATGDSEGDYKIDEYTVLSRTFGGVMEQVQHSFDRVFDEDLRMGTGGKKEWQEGEHKARPWDSYAIIDSETGAVVVTDAEQRARTDKEASMLLDEMPKMDIFQKEMIQPKKGQEWEGHGQAIYQRIETEPVGFLMELPAEAALFLIPIPLRVPLIAGLKIGATVTSQAAKTILKTGGFTTQTVSKSTIVGSPGKQVLREKAFDVPGKSGLTKITGSIRHAGSYLPMSDSVATKLYTVAKVTPDVIEQKARNVLYANISFDAGKAIIKSNFQKAVSAQWDKVPQPVKTALSPVVAKVQLLGGLEEVKFAKELGGNIKIIGSKKVDYVPPVPRETITISPGKDVLPRETIEKTTSTVPPSTTSPSFGVPLFPKIGIGKLFSAVPKRIDAAQAGVTGKGDIIELVDVIPTKLTFHQLPILFDKTLGTAPIRFTDRPTLPVGTDIMSYGGVGSEATLTLASIGRKTLSGDDFFRTPISTSLSGVIERGVLPKPPKLGRPSKIKTTPVFTPAVTLFPTSPVYKAVLSDVKITNKGITELEQALWGGGRGSQMRGADDVLFPLGADEGVLRGTSRFAEPGSWLPPAPKKVREIEALRKSIWKDRDEIAKITKKTWRSEKDKIHLKVLKSRLIEKEKTWKDFVGVRQVEITPGITGVGEWITVGSQRGIRITSVEFDALGKEMFVTKERIGKSFKKDVKVYTFTDQPVATAGTKLGKGWIEIMGQKGWITKGMEQEIKKKGTLTFLDPFGRLGTEASAKSAGFSVKVDKSFAAKGQILIRQIDAPDAQTMGLFLQIIATTPRLTRFERMAQSEFIQKGGKLGEMDDFDAQAYLGGRWEAGSKGFAKHEEDLTAEIKKYTQMTPKQFQAETLQSMLKKNLKSLQKIVGVKKISEDPFDEIARRFGDLDPGKFKKVMQDLTPTSDIYRADWYGGIITPVGTSGLELSSIVKRMLIQSLEEKRQTPRLWLRVGGTDLMTPFQKKYSKQLFHDDFSKQEFGTAKKGAVQAFFDAVDSGVSIKQALADTPPNLKTIAMTLKEGVTDQFGRKHLGTRIPEDEAIKKKKVYQATQEEEVFIKDPITGEKKVVHERVLGQRYATPDYMSGIGSIFKEQPVTAVVLTEKELADFQKFKTFYTIFGDTSEPRLYGNVMKTEAAFQAGEREISSVLDKLNVKFAAQKRLTEVSEIKFTPDMDTDVFAYIQKHIKPHGLLHEQSVKLSAISLSVKETEQKLSDISARRFTMQVEQGSLKTELKYRVYDKSEGGFVVRYMSVEPTKFKGSYTVDESGFYKMKRELGGINNDEIIYTPEFTLMKKPKGEPTWTEPKSAAEQRVDNINKRIKQLRDKVAVIKEGEKIIPGTSVAKKQLKENLDEIASLKAELKAKKPKIGTDMEDEILGVRTIGDGPSKGILNPDYMKFQRLTIDIKQTDAQHTRLSKTQKKQRIEHADAEKVHDFHFQKLMQEGDPDIAMQGIMNEIKSKVMIDPNSKMVTGLDLKTGETLYFGVNVKPFGKTAKFRLSQAQMKMRAAAQVQSYLPSFNYYVKKNGKWVKTKEPLGTVVETQGSMPKSYWRAAPDGTFKKTQKKVVGFQKSTLHPMGGYRQTKGRDILGVPRLTTLGGIRDPTSSYQDIFAFGRISSKDVPADPYQLVNDVILYSKADREFLGDTLSKGYFSTVGLLQRTLNKQAIKSVQIGNLQAQITTTSTIRQEIKDLKSQIKFEKRTTVTDATKHQRAQPDWAEIHRLEKQVEFKEQQLAKYGSDTSGIVEGEQLATEIGRMQNLITSVKQMETALDWTSKYMKQIGQAKKLSEPSGYGKKNVLDDIYSATGIRQLSTRLGELKTKQVTLGHEADEAKHKLSLLTDGTYKPPSTFVTGVTLTTAVGMKQNMPAWSRYIMGEVKNMPSYGNYYKKQYDVYDVGRGGASVFKTEKLSLTGRVITRLTKQWSPVPEFVMAGRRAQGKTDASGKTISITEDELEDVIGKLFKSTIDMDKAGFPVPIKKVVNKFKKTAPYDKTVGGALITKYHVRQVEKEIGYSLEPFADDIVDIIKSGKMGASYKNWQPENYNAWKSAILDRSRSEKLMKSVLKTQVGKKTDKSITTFVDQLKSIRARVDTPTIDPTGKRIEDLAMYRGEVGKLEELLRVSKKELDAKGLSPDYVDTGYYSTILKRKLPDKSWEDWLMKQEEVVDLKMPGRQANIDPDGGYTIPTSLKEQLDIDWMFGSVRQRTFDDTSPAYRPGTTLPFRSTSAWQKFQLLINTELSTTAFRDVLSYWKVMGTGSTFGNLTSRKHIVGTLDVMKRRLNLSNVAQDAPGMSSGTVISDNVRLLLHQFVTRPLHTIKTGFRRDVATDVKFGSTEIGTSAFADQKQLWNVHISNMKDDWYGPRVSAEILGVHEVMHQVLSKHGLRRSTFDWDVLEYGGLGGKKAFDVPSFGIPGREDFPLRTAKKLGLPERHDPISNIPDYPITTGDYERIAAEQLAAKTERYPAGTIIGGKDVGGQLTPQTLGDIYGPEFKKTLTPKQKMLYEHKEIEAKLDAANLNLKEAKEDLYGSVTPIYKKVKKVVEEGTYPTGERKFSVVISNEVVDMKIKQGLLYKDPALVDQFLMNQIELARDKPTRDFLRELQVDLLREKAEKKGPKPPTPQGKGQVLKPQKSKTDKDKTEAQKYMERNLALRGTYSVYNVPYYQVAYPAGVELPKMIKTQDVYAGQETGPYYAQPEPIAPGVIAPAPMPQMQPLQPSSIALYNPFTQTISDASRLGISPIVGTAQIPFIKQITDITPITGITQAPIQGSRVGEQFARPPIPRMFVGQVPKPVTPPVPYPPGGILFPGWWLDAQRKKPRKQKIRKRRRRKLWWDVPFQPLGEPWAAKEYVVFTGAEPKKVKKKEKKKGLDDWLNFSFND